MGARQPLRDGTGDSIGADARRDPSIRQTGIPMRHKETTPRAPRLESAAGTTRREWLARGVALGAVGLAGYARRDLRD